MMDLKECQVAAQHEAVGLEIINLINVETINQKELLKAACCNLSEAFETSPTVNVSYKDAVRSEGNSNAWIVGNLFSVDDREYPKHAGYCIGLWIVFHSCPLDGIYTGYQRFRISSQWI